MLLHEKGIRAFTKVVHRSCKLKMVPFYWNCAAIRMQVANSDGLIVSFFISAAAWFRLVHLLISFAYWKHEMSSSRQALHLIWIITNFLGAIFSYNHFQLRHQLVAFSNRFFGHHQHLNRNF